MKHRLSSHPAFRVCILLLVLLAAPLVLTERGVRAQAAHKAEAATDKPITLDLYDVSMTEALTACCKQAGCTYHIGEAIQGFVAHERRTVRMKAVPFETVLKAILEPGTAFAHSYSYRKVGNGFRIEGPKVSSHLKQARPTDVLKSLLDYAGENYIFPPDAFNGAPMDFVVADMPVEQALTQFLARFHSPQPLKVVTLTGIFVFFNDLTGQKRPTIPKGVDPQEYDRIGQVTVKFQDVERRDALRALFQVYQQNYSINIPLPGKVSMEKEKHFRGILREILRVEGSNYTYKVMNDVYTIARIYVDSFEE